QPLLFARWEKTKRGRCAAPCCQPLNQLRQLAAEPCRGVFDKPANGEALCTLGVVNGSLMEAESAAHPAKGWSKFFHFMRGCMIEVQARWLHSSYNDQGSADVVRKGFRVSVASTRNHAG
ncbi:MAG TPA: hypothetical protein VHY20_05520, partial [Pirellulales bacterium]|nr:hypothetical protein [Pirellulales bacterium]